MSQISSASFTFSPATGPSRKNGCVPKIKAAKSLKKKKNHNNKKKIVIITNKKKATSNLKCLGIIFSVL